MIWTFIQARTGSHRLPRKVLYPLGDGLLIDSVNRRASRLGPPVAWLIPHGDTELAKACIGRGWTYFEGDEHDVLSRFVDSARRVRADHIVRITADCPFLDVEAGRWTIQEHLDSPADLTRYVAEGRGVEVFTRAALEDSYRQLARFAGTSFYREHPDEWILRNPRMYLVNTLKFSVDTADELETARRRLNGNKTGVRHVR